MSEAKHSPGPWFIDPASDVETTAISSVARCGICIIQHDDDRPWGEKQTEADAKLIVAAPDLLDALKGLLDAIERTPCHCHEAYTGRGLTDPSCIRCGLDLTSEELDAARAAIAKAAL